MLFSTFNEASDKRLDILFVVDVDMLFERGFFFALLFHHLNDSENN